MRLGDTSKFDSRQTVFNKKVLKLEISASCNASCIFCPMFKNSHKQKGFMTFDDLLMFIDLNGLYIRESGFEIEPFFNGETLLHPRALEMMEVISKAGLCLGELDTNLSVRIDIARLARIPLRRLTINIGGLDNNTNNLVMGTNLERVLMNVKKLMGESLRTFDVCLKMNPVRANLHQVDSLDHFVRDIHPELHWKAQQTGLPVPSDLSKNERDQFFLETYSNERPDLFRFRLNDDKTKFVPRNNRCLYMTPCINTDGSVTICAHDQLRHYNFGNVFRDKLEDILMSADYKLALLKGKKRGLDICNGCN